MFLQSWNLNSRLLNLIELRLDKAASVFHFHLDTQKAVQLWDKATQCAQQRFNSLLKMSKGGNLAKLN